MTRALRIEDIEGVPWMAGMTWHPVRMELGLHAFGAAGFEWLMRAKPHMATDPGRAREILSHGLAELPGSAAIPYGFALLEATQGDVESARASLAEAISREPRLRDDAAREPLLAAITPAA